MESTAIVTIMTALMTGAVAFTLGYWWAAIVEADRRPGKDAARPPIVNTPNLSIQRSDVEIIRREVAKLFRYCNSSNNEIPAKIVKSLNEILAVVSKLAEQYKQTEQLEKSGKETAAERQRIAQPADEPKPSNESVLSVDDVSKLIESADVHRQGKKVRINSKRYPFRLKKTLFPCQNRLPKKDEFQFVECLDVGARGMSLFVENSPEFETFLISLGDQSNPIIMLGNVVDERACVVNGMVGFRVNARFVRRLDDRYAKLFHEAYGSLEIASQSPATAVERQSELSQAGQV